jgi:hypothetical protein
VCIAALASSNDDCEKPLRAWLYVTLGVLFLHSVSLVVLGKLGQQFAATNLALNTIALSFLFLWMTLGVTWIFHDDDCIDDYEHGFYAVATVAAAFFGVFALAVLLMAGITCVVCVGAFCIRRVIEPDD